MPSNADLRRDLDAACKKLPASALGGAEPIETFLLLVAQRSVKLLERGLHGLHRAQHRVEQLGSWLRKSPLAQRSRAGSHCIGGAAAVGVDGRSRRVSSTPAAISDESKPAETSPEPVRARARGL